MATASGLAVYDGESVKVFNRGHGLLSHGMRHIGHSGSYALICSDSGLDWFSCDDMEVCFQLNTAAEGWGLCEVAASISEKDYLLGCAKGLFKVSLGQSNVEFYGGWLSGEYVTALASNNNGIALLNSSKTGLWSFQDNQLKPIVSRQLAHLGRCVSIRFVENQFLITFENGVAILDALLQVTLAVSIGEEFSSLLSFCPVNDEVIWVATADGVFRCKVDEPLKVNPEKCYLSNMQINDIVRDSFGNLWCASEHKGLHKIPIIEQWIKLANPVDNNSYLSLRVLDEFVFIGGTQQSMLLNRKTSESQHISALNGLQVWDLQKAPENNSDNTKHTLNDEIWAATNKGVKVLQDISLRNTELDDYNLGIEQPCRCFYFIEQYVLIGSITGLYLYDRVRKVIEPVYSTNGDSIGYVYSIQSTDDKTIYIATLGRGLWSYNWSNRELLQVELGQDYSNIYSVAFKNSKLYSVSADNQILIYCDKGFKPIYRSSLSVAAWAMEKLTESLLLLGTSEGLQVLNLETGSVNFTLDQFPNGSYWEFTTSRSLAIIDGVAWCGLNDFLSVADIQQLRAVIPPIQPAIVGIMLDSESVKLNNNIRIDQGDWILKIELSCHWFWSKSYIKYQYRLLGLQADWIDIIGNQIILTTLPPGSYLLEIKASCNFSSTPKAIQLLELEIIPSSLLLRFIHFISQSIGRLSDYFANKTLLRKHRAEFNHLEETIKRRTQQLNQANKQLEQQNKALVEMSTIDSLTGLYNRRYFSEQAMKEVKRAVRSQLPMCLLMIDIDHFKQYNDHYGHKQGDECLKQVALKIRKSFNRSTDITARYGGEEFIVLLPETTFEEAKLAIEKCLNNVRKSELEHAKSATSSIVTISIGAACDTPQYDFDQKSTAAFLSELIEKADVNLYHAKNNGRNRYHC